jgi:membrane associated rhomboid family serine protease
MRQAAVGFQCPSCVSEGAKSTRSGRTAYGGAVPANPALTSQILIALNVAVWLLILVTGGRASVWIDRLALLPDGPIVFPNGFVLPVDGVADGAYWQLVTSVFTHVDIWHIGFNMLALWFLGPHLESALGRARFLTLYLLSGLAGSALVYWLADVNGFTLGASGAIFGLMGGLLVVALKVRGDVSQLLMWIGLNFVITVLGRGFISWQGHLGGFVGGAVIAAILVYAPRTQRLLWQVAGLSVFGVLLLAAFTTRTLVLT